MIHKNLGLTAILCAILLLGFVGCSRRYMLAGQPPVGLHCMYESSREFKVFAKRQDPAENILKRAREDEKVRGIVVETRDDGKQVHLILTTDIKRRVFEFQRGGKDDEDLRKRHEKVYVTMRADPMLIGPEGENSVFWVSHLPAGLPNYLLEKLRALPTKPVAIGEIWQADITGDNYSGHAVSKLVRVEHVEGRMVATIEGSYEATWNVKIPEGENVTITYKGKDYIRKLDVTTHTTNRESYTLNIQYESSEMDVITSSRNALTLLNREMLDNEEWQPGIRNFANAILKLREGGEEKINKHMLYMQKLADFAKKNPDTVCGKIAQVFIDKQQFLGKNIFDFITLENCEDWLNGPSLKDEDIRGKVFLIEFWSTNCGGCVMATPMLAGLYKEFSPRGFVIVGVTPEQKKEREEIVAHLKKHNIAYPNLWDKDRILDKALDVEYMSFALLVNSRGIVVWEGSLHPSDEKAFRKAIRHLLKQGE